MLVASSWSASSARAVSTAATTSGDGRGIHADVRRSAKSPVRRREPNRPGADEEQPPRRRRCAIVSVHRVEHVRSDREPADRGCSEVGDSGDRIEVVHVGRRPGGVGRWLCRCSERRDRPEQLCDVLEPAAVDRVRRRRGPGTRALTSCIVVTSDLISTSIVGRGPGAERRLCTLRRSTSSRSNSEVLPSAAVVRRSRPRLT